MAFHINVPVSDTKIEDKEFKVLGSSSNKIQKPGTYALTVQSCQIKEWDKSPDFRKAEICFIGADERTYTKTYMLPVLSNPLWVYNDRKWMFQYAVQALLKGFDIAIDNPDALNRAVSILFHTDDFMMCQNIVGLVCNLTLGYKGKYADYDIENKQYVICNVDGSLDPLHNVALKKWDDVKVYCAGNGLKLESLDVLEASPVAEDANYVRLAEMFG